jgi:hypothetical protein
VSAARSQGAGRAVPAGLALRRLMFESFPLFMSRLVDPAGRPLEVAPHHELWAKDLATSDRVVLLAPRSHGKTLLVLSYVLWRFWRHGRSPTTCEPLPGPAGAYEVALLSATRAQALEHVATFKDLLLANETLLGPLPAPGQPGTTWSATKVRLNRGQTLLARGYRTSTRGMHPALLILDDSLSDANSGTERQRDLTWRYFTGTLLPMRPGQVIVIGTAFHRDDLLHRLGPAGPGAALGFAWHRFTALDPGTGAVLWHRHPFEVLERLRAADPLTFSREFQNDPRDDAASMFPHELTARALAADLTYLPRYRCRPGEAVVFGLDLAVGEAASADYTVLVVAALDLATLRRRVLRIWRVRGLDLAAQVALVRRACADYDVTLGIVEENGFQRWLLQELRRHPETAGRIFGHATGMERSSLEDGIPALKLSLQDGLWTLPCGDPASAPLAQAWQAELAAFGWRDGHLTGVGEHDDLVLATWFVERAVRRVVELLAGAPRVEIVTGEDLGLERYRISPELDAADAAWGGLGREERQALRWLLDD